jgi:hypothetical protein
MQTYESIAEKVADMQLQPLEIGLPHLYNCGGTFILKVADFGEKNCDCGIVDMQLRSDISF